MKTIILTAAFASLILSGCANLTPDYVRPAMPIPAQITPSGETAERTLSAHRVPAWDQLISDARLKEVIQLALDNNRDLRVAALNIEKERAQYNIQSASLYPAVTAGVEGSSNLYNGTITRKYTAGLTVSSFEIDFFGRLRNLKDEALETFLATEASKQSTQLSLISDVSTAWLTLAADKKLLRLAQETWMSRQKTLDLTEKQQQLGGASGLTVAQARASMESARADMSAYTSQVAQALNSLVLLVGASVPEKFLPTDQDEASVAALIELPVGLSSDILLSRPDIIAAEHTLKAKYADIGAARAAFFPSVTLTGTTGSASSSLNSLFDAGTRAWSFVPSISVPIFNAGSLRASLSVAEVSRDIQVATYEKTVQTAFQEVSNALAVRSTLGERMRSLEAQVKAYDTSLKLSTARYRYGADSYLEVLDSQRSLYTAQQSLISLQLAEQANRITLYKVLGGS